jgi:PAS domain S-box-containing protein
MSSILVLDDRADARDLLATVLEHVGHTVIEASDGEQALVIVRKQRPDLVIADLLMDAMNGYEFVRRLRADPELHGTRVMFCTATYVEAEVRHIAESCGVSHILVKPCEPEEIIRVVSAALDAHVSPGPPIVPAEFDKEQLRVLNSTLVKKVDELETLRDELRHAQRETAESLTLLETIQLAAPIGFGFIDREFRVRHVNPMLASMHGLSADRYLGLTIAEGAPEYWPQLEPLLGRVLDTGEAVLNREALAELQSAPGKIRQLLASYYPVRLGGEVIGIGIIVVDITERLQAADFWGVVMQTMDEGLYVLDEEGRLVFMNAAAAKMLGWTEDELRGEPVHEAIHYQHADGSPFPAEECDLLKVRTERRTLRVTEDAFTRKDGSIIPVAYSAAPLLNGTNVRGAVVVFRDTTEEQAERTRAQRELDQLAWVGRIRDALDDHRLVLYTQPIVPLTGASTAGEELLIRMVGQKGEIIAPGSFLPVAEKFGQIREIDQWVIAQAAKLAAAGRHVHANLSADSINNLDLLPVIEHELSSAGADPANLVFEITETALMVDVDAGEAFTRGLAEIGCPVALDDFGTGYGSFTYLQKLRSGYLKIDIAFVRDLVSNPANQHLVKATVNIAKGFGLQTIAEGVEDGDTLDLLREYGVDLAQGFYLGRPAPISDDT